MCSVEIAQGFGLEIFVQNMQIWKRVLIVVTLGLSNLVSTAAPSSGRRPFVNTRTNLQLPASSNGSISAKTPNGYPLDPYQMRVSDTTTSLIFSKYGRPIHFQTFLDLTAKAQYQTVKAVVAAHRDGHVPQPNFEWSKGRLYIRISRPLAQEELTWLMLANTLEGSRLFLGELEGWFETSITILDDAAGPVGSGSIVFG